MSMNQEVNAKFDINLIGSESGNPYNGSFKVRTLLTRRQLAMADEVRRDIIGKDPDNAFPKVKTDAFIAGQLAVRVLDAPKWFQDAGPGGIDLPDNNVLELILDKAIQCEADRKDKILGEAKKAEEDLKSKEEK